MQRRQLLQGLAASGGFSLLARSLATGLPVSFLLGSRQAHADVNLPRTPVLMVLNVDGDPLNANCPGSYVAGVSHPEAFKDGEAFKLGAVDTVAAAPWSKLPEALRNQLAFVHYATYAVAHNQFDTVLKLNRAAKGLGGNGEEMLPTLLGQELFDPTLHIQSDPIGLGTTSVSVQGSPIPNYSPDSLSALFAGQGPAAQLESLGKLRDQTLDAMYASVKKSGLPSQRAFLDRYVISRSQAADLGAGLGTALSKLPPADDDGNNQSAQIFTALALLQAGITPIVTVWVPFGGDNHHDAGFAVETEETQAGVDAIQYAWEQSQTLSALKDNLTFCTFNTFGRTLTSKDGRSHNPNHHAMALFGPHVNAGVYGAPQASEKDFGAAPFDPATGKVVAEGKGISPDDSLAVAGRTLAAVTGVPSERRDKRIPNAKEITGLIKST